MLTGTSGARLYAEALDTTVWTHCLPKASIGDVLSKYCDTVSVLSKLSVVCLLSLNAQPPTNFTAIVYFLGSSKRRWYLKRSTSWALSEMSVGPIRQSVDKIAPIMATE